MNRTIAGLVLVVIASLVWTGPGQCQSELLAGVPIFTDVPAIVPVGGPITGTVKLSDGQGGFITTDTVSITVDHTGWNPPAPAAGTINLNMSSTDTTFMGAVILTATNTSITPNKTSTVTVQVVGVTRIQYEIGTTFVDMPANLSVPVGVSQTFKAIPSYGTTFPAGQPVWGGLATGTGDQTTVTFNTVSQAVGDQLVNAKCGIQTPVPAILTAVQVAKLQVQQGSAWNDITEPLAVPVGTSLTFKAIPAPAGATFPTGNPVWGGLAGGTADQATVPFNALSYTVGDQPLTAKCGTQTPVEADVTAYIVTIGVRREGAVDTEGHPVPYAFKAIVAAGGNLVASDEHVAEVQLAICPAVQGHSLSVDLVGGAGFNGGAARWAANAASTDAQGLITGTLTSSNLVELVVLQAVDPLGHTTACADVEEHWDDISDGTEWVADPFFSFDTPSMVSFKPGFTDGENVPITGHTMDFQMPSYDVWEYNDATGNYDCVQGVRSSDLPGLADFNPVTTSDNPPGVYSSQLTVHWDNTGEYIVDTVYFDAQDDGVFMNP